jgi:flavin reductase (DIM6/NTAB) family NADH-FMN oxidoreductase RutF
MENKTRTLQMVGEMKTFSISILNSKQRDLSLVFAGKIGDTQDRFVSLKTITLSGGLIAIDHALAWLECKVREIIPLKNSTLILADVISTQINTIEESAKPLVYHDRGYHTI